jgi:hypothetical protein
MENIQTKDPKTAGKIIRLERKKEINLSPASRLSYADMTMMGQKPEDLESLRASDARPRS